MLEECLKRLPRICVVVYFYCFNDCSESVRGDIYYPALAPFLRRGEEPGDWIEMEVTDPVVPWGRDFLPFIEEKMQRRAASLPRKRLDRELRDRLREHSALFHLVQSRVSSIIDSMRRSGETGRSGVSERSRRVEDVDKGRHVMVHLLKQMGEACRTNGVAFLVTAYTYGKRDPEIESWCKEAGVRFVSVHQAFTAEPHSYFARKRDGDYEWHYGPEGTKSLAEALAPALRQALSTCGRIPQSSNR